MNEQERREFQRENFRKAIAIMTAWYETNDPSTSLVPSIAEDELDEDSGVGLAAGLISLCGQLLMRVEKLSGVAVEATLQDVARMNESR